MTEAKEPQAQATPSPAPDQVAEGRKPRKRKRKRLAVNVLLLVSSTVLALGLAEALLRFLKPYSGFGAATELPWMRNHPYDLSKVFTLDPDLGYHPILGNDIYTTYGTLAFDNNYKPAKRPGITRLLFIGDSVTARGRIVHALKEIYGEERYEFWNAGVDGYNTVQEVKYYKKYNRFLKPDHVVLTFHINDFEVTPVAFLDGNGRLVVYAPRAPLRRTSRWLFGHSYLYRALIRVTLQERKGRERIEEETLGSLKELKALLDRDGISLTVLALPVMKPEGEWRSHEREAKAKLLEMLDAERIRHFDLLPPLREAIRRGINIQEQPGDVWHPSAELAKLFAQFLLENHIF